jgi:(R,R)-butanediol dehydrogenase/meso-butanediol dehydrogenase/diacetyl reductase
MRGVRWHARDDIRVEEMPDPEPRPGEVILEVEACGVCGTDVEEARHGPLSIPTEKPNPVTGCSAPVVLGHEIVGKVALTGVGVTIGVGTRVAPWIIMPCRRCEECQAGSEHRCPTMGILGLSADGGFAEYIRVFESACVPVSPDLPPERAALVEPYAVCLHGMSLAPVDGRRVVVIGSGSIGLSLVDLASSLGAADVTVLARSPDGRRAAVAGGASAAFDPAEASGVRAEIAFEATGSQTGISIGLQALRPGGRLVSIGTSASDIPLPIERMVLGEIEIIGSMGYRLTEFERAADLLSRGTVRGPVRPIEVLGHADVQRYLTGKLAIASAGKPVFMPGVPPRSGRER